MAEQWPFKPLVEGSSPSTLTLYFNPPATPQSSPRPAPRPRTALPDRTARCRAGFISCSSVVRMRAPEQPSGCPSAIAPPLTLTISGSRPNSSHHRQRLHRKGFVEFDQVESSSFKPGAVKCFARRRDRPQPHGARVARRPPPKPPCAPAASAPAPGLCSALITSRAAAPSFSPEEFPAVTVPPSLRKAGLSLASDSIVVSRRGRSSVSTIRVALPLWDRHRDDLLGKFAGIDGRNRPLVRAQGERILHLAGDVRLHARRYSPPSRPSLGAVQFLHLRVGVAPAQGGIVGGQVAKWKAASALGSEYGARDMLSTPPAMKTSPSPARMARAAWLTACQP